MFKSKFYMRLFYVHICNKSFQLIMKKNGQEYHQYALIIPKAKYLFSNQKAKQQFFKMTKK